MVCGVDLCCMQGSATCGESVRLQAGDERTEKVIVQVCLC